MVTGVTEDVPAHSHFTYDVLLSFITFPLSESTSWASYTVHTYAVLDRAESRPALESKFIKMVEQYFGPEVENILGKKYTEYLAAGNHHYYHLQPVRDIHLHSHYQQELAANGDIRYVYLFAVVCFFILFIAGVNFTNLSTVRSLRRAKEIAVRKVHGSLKKQLIFQFLAESVMVTAIATVISALAVILLLKGFNDFTSKSISLTQVNWGVAAIVLLLLMVVNGVLAGVYPAFFVSALQPIQALKGNAQKGSSKSMLRSVLIVVQFGISVVLIVSTLAIYRQLEFMREKRLGFDQDHILVLERANQLFSQRKAFDEELRQIPGVNVVSNGFNVPGRLFSGSTFQAIGAEATERIHHNTSFGEFHTLNALGLELIAGRNFSEDIKGDSLSVVVNEALVKRVGWKSAEEALGQKIKPVFNMAAQYEIIGVVKDFNYESLHSAIEPLGIYGNDNDDFNATLSLVRTQAGIDVQSLLATIENKWKQFLPGEEFEYTFVDEQFGGLYLQEERFGKIFTLFSILAIVIASIGVIGLATFMANQRTKEIGIRKVIGATVGDLILLLARDFLKLIVIANVVFWPLAWYGLTQWLSQYPFRTELTLALFVITGCITALIVFISVFWQSLKAALMNPVKSLRSE